MKLAKVMVWLLGVPLGAPPDGYTLTMAVSSGFGINPTLYPKLPYDARSPSGARRCGSPAPRLNDEA